MRWWVAVLALALWAPAARADDLTLAREHIGNLAYTEAVNVLESMIRRGDADVRQLGSAYELLARAAASSGQDAQAIRAYQRLLALAPAFQLGQDESPRLRRDLDAARSQLPAGAAIRVTVRAPLEAWRQRPTSLTLVVRADGLGLVRGMRVYHRRAGAALFSRVTVRGPPPLEAIVPAFSSARAGRLEYWVAALDDFGNEIGAVGSAGRPMSLAVRDPPTSAPRTSHRAPRGPSDGGGIATRWWFWTGLVAIAAGATVGAILLTSQEPDCPERRTCFDVLVERP